MLRHTGFDYILPRTGHRATQLQNVLVLAHTILCKGLILDRDNREVCFAEFLCAYLMIE